MASQKDRLITILDKVTDAVNALLVPVTPGENAELDPILDEIESEFARLNQPVPATDPPAVQ